MVLPIPEINEEQLFAFALQLGIKETTYGEFKVFAEELAARQEVPLRLTWNPISVAMYSVERSEHCDYPHSRPYISRLVAPRGKEHIYPMLRGAEAGGFELPGGLVVLFKMESHNHPSREVPLQGAATGIGGIIRDILAMGARPMLLMDPLYFGPAANPSDKVIGAGVVEGIGWYGNCVGLPNLGGQIILGEGYVNKPIVNVVCLGIGKKDKLITAKASGPGNVVLIVGNDTGPDGIGGASVLASQTYEQGREKISAVQVGDPYRGKCLIEAYLECVEAGLIVAAKDMGAAGLTCTTTEMCVAGNVGMEIDLVRVPLRVSQMHGHEIMMSESQERMLIVAKLEDVPRIRQIFEEKWELHAEPIGFVTEQPLLTIKNGENVMAVVDPHHMVGGPVIPLRPQKPAYLESLRIEGHTLPEPADYIQTLLRLLASPNISSKLCVWRQYDRHVGTNTVLEAGSADAGIIRIRETTLGLAVTNDCNPRYCYLDPKMGAQIAIAEAARNLVCVGAEPIALTDCLNFGDPDNPEVAWQFEQTIEGMEKALTVLQIAVVSGNVSFYNHDAQGPIWPTPTIGMVGVLHDVDQHRTPAFRQDKDHIYIVGPLGEGHLGGTEYLSVIHGMTAGQPPPLDLPMEDRVQNCVRTAIREGLLSSAHDCSQGGLLVTVAESAMLGARGAHLKLEHLDARHLFGEDQSRIVVSLPDSKVTRLAEIAARENVPLTSIGTIEGTTLVVEPLDDHLGRIIDVPVADLTQTWESALEKSLYSPPA